MKNNDSTPQPQTTTMSQTQNYSQVKSEISTKWPDWKKAAYNNYFATSAHAEKVIVK